MCLLAHCYQINHLFNIGLYVGDFCYFSPSDEIEIKFKYLLVKKYSVSYEDKLDWFLGMTFEWKETADDLVCLCHQEAFVLDMVDQYYLADYNKSPRTSPFKCGLPIDTTMEDCSLSTMDQKDTTKRHQQIMGNLNWLSISTRLDLTCIHSLLSAYSHRPSKAHLWSSTLLVIKYCASNPSHWLFFSYKQSSRHKAFSGFHRLRMLLFSPMLTGILWMPQSHQTLLLLQNSPYSLFAPSQAGL